jgi:hypothetical protein
MAATLAINWKLFCGGLSKYDIDNPFVIRGWMYATDARICIRMPSDDPDTDGRFPDAPSLFKSFPALSTFTPVTDPTYSDIVQTCTACKGLNVRPKDWDDSLDPGVWDDGNGNCRDCGGSGRTVAGSAEPMAGRLIRTTYANWMRTLPCLQIGADVGDPMAPLRFVFAGGGEGMITPVKRPDPIY